MLWEQFIRPSLKTMRTLVIRLLQGYYGNAVPLSYPDTWARKSDCLHLPYTVSSTKPSIGEGFLLRGGIFFSGRKLLQEHPHADMGQSSSEQLPTTHPSTLEGKTTLHILIKGT